MYTTNDEKACVLFALDAMFGNTIDWGKDFLVEYYEEFGYTGFKHENLYLLEECAPIKLLQYGTFAVNYRQPSVYTYLYDKGRNIRYRVHRSTLVMMIYGSDDWSHAVAIPSSEVIVYMRHYDFHGLALPLQNLLVDNRTYDDDVRDGIIIK